MPVYPNYVRSVPNPSGRRATYDVSLIHSYSPFDERTDLMNIRNHRINSEPTVPSYYSDFSPVNYSEPSFTVTNQVNHSFHARPRGFAIGQNVGEDFFEDPSEFYVPLYSDYPSGDSSLFEWPRTRHSSDVYSGEYIPDYCSMYENRLPQYCSNSFYSNRSVNYVQNRSSKGSRSVQKMDSKKVTTTEVPALWSPDEIDPVCVFWVVLV